MDKAEHSLQSLGTKAAGLGESLKGSFERLPSLLSGGGIEASVTGLSAGFTSLAERVAHSASHMGPRGVGLGLVAGAAALAAAAVAGLALGIYKLVEPQIEAIDANYKLAQALRIPTDQ